MLDHEFSWQTETKSFGPDYAWADELKGLFDASKHPRSKDGRFGSGPGKTPVGQVYLDAQKVGGAHKITVHNSRVRKYAGHDSVESFIAGHKRGRAAAMRELTADHASGKISFGHPETGEAPAAAKPKGSPASAEQRVAGALHELGDGGRNNVRLSALRAKVSDLPRESVDKALTDMRAKGHANLMNLDNPRDVAAEASSALAVRNGAGHKIMDAHVAQLTPEGRAAMAKPKDKALGRGLGDLMKENAAGGKAGPATEKAPGAGKTPAAKPKKADAGTMAEKPAAVGTGNHSTVAQFDAGRSTRMTSYSEPTASLKPITRDPKRSDLDTLKAAHAQISDSGDVARLSHVRAVLGNYSRPEQDRMLQGALHSSSNSGVSLSTISSNRDIDSKEEAAQFGHASNPFHLLRATHKGRKSVDDFDADDLDAIDAVTP